MNDNHKQGIPEMSKDVFEIRGELKEVRRNLEGIHQTERTSARIVGLGLTVFLGVLGIANIWFSNQNLERVSASIERNDSQLRQMLANAEIRIQELTGSLRPTHSVWKSRTSDNPDTVQFGLAVSWNKNDGLPRFRLNAETHLLAETFGPHGIFVGSQSYLSGEIVNFLSKRSNPNLTNFLVENFSTPKLNFERPEGIISIEGAPINIRYTFSVDYATCREADEALDWLIRKGNDSGTLYFRPIYRTIDNQPNFKDFAIDFFDARLFDCSKIEPLFDSEIAVE